MSREIKFRVWDTSSNKWASGLKMTLDGRLKDIDFDDEGRYEFELRLEQYTIEQYTGLKDKNGKEIYEGDIIKARDWDGSWGKYRIKWKQSHCAFEAFEYRKSKAWNWTLKGFVDIEVIGNIHENPELSEVE